MEKNRKLNRLPEQPTSYIPLGQPGHWTQEIDQIKKSQPRNRLGVKHIYFKKKDVLRQALLWQLDRFVPYKAIEDLLWGHQEDGGPLYAHHVIAVMIHYLRKQGYNIETWSGIGVRMRPRD